MWVAPILRRMIGAFGIPTSVMISGIVVVVAMVFFAQFVKASPPGYISVEDAAKAGAPAKPKMVNLGISPDSMICTWQFKVMFACFAFGGGAGIGVSGLESTATGGSLS